jgi:hypothetical protein
MEKRLWKRQKAKGNNAKHQREKQSRQKTAQIQLKPIAIHTVQRQPASSDRSALK